MPKKIVSFGERHGQPPSFDALIIDVRRVFNRNPWRRGDLRFKTGLDPEVQADVSLTPYFEESYNALAAQVLQSSAETVYLGCTGGRHRSVFLAERLGKDLGILVEHRDINKLDISNSRDGRRTT